MRLIGHLSSALAVAIAAPVSADLITYVLPPGNACDVQASGCYGAVGYIYFISKTEVTNAQYAQFLNWKAAADPLGLYNTNMGSGLGGIARSGSAGSYSYTAIAGRANLPVNYVSLYDAMRYANWANNGAGATDTETGMYTLLGGTPIPSNGATLTRNSPATAPHAADGSYVFLPTEDEWYKAAYYDRTTASYFDYPTSSDVEPVCSAPTATPNHANCDFQPDVTNVGAYPGSASPYGTFDQAGNVWEWTETIVASSNRGIRGGALDIPAVGAAASTRASLPPDAEIASMGFRFAPEPGRGVLIAAGSLLLGWLRHRRR